MFGGPGGTRSRSATPELLDRQRVAVGRFVSKLPPAVLTHDILLVCREIEPAEPDQ